MAEFSFLDLMLAEALASGLAREARRQERPPPENFFVLPRDPDAWKKFQEASKKENMVVCIEFTDGSNENCRRIQSVFMDMAREFDGIPFLRVVVGPGATYNEMRSDLGGVQYTPTILIVFFGDGSVSRAKFEGEGEIKRGLNTGSITNVIKELMDRRVKLKLAERMAEGLAEQMKSHISDRERKLREEYEERLRRQVAEKEEEFKRKEEERLKKETAEQQKGEQYRQKLERIRQERPRHLNELLKMDLDRAPARDLKAIMIKMGISPHGCFEKSDLKKKLFDNVPELRIRTTGPSEGTEKRSKNNSMSEDDPLGAGSSSEIDSLKKELAQMKSELALKKSELAKANGEVSSLRSHLAMLKNNKPSGQESKEKGTVRIMELETDLLETRMLYTTTLENFENLEVVQEPSQESESLILRGKCIKHGIPHQDRVYIIKVLQGCFQTQTYTKARNHFQNEYQVLCQLPPHENIIKMWAFFYDRADPNTINFFKKGPGKEYANQMALFLLMEEHVSSMAEHLSILVENQGPNKAKVIAWFKDLLKGLVFMEKHKVVHRDLKLNNLLMSKDGKLVISDFGKAIIMEDGNFKVKNSPGMDIGGNHAHLAPEILNCRSGRTLDYSRQSVWAAGVLAYELAGHPSPFKSGSIDQRGYSVRNLPTLKHTQSSSNIFQELPDQLTKLVQTMLEPDLNERPNLQRCLDKINTL